MSSLVKEVEDGTILVSADTRTGTGEEIRPLLVADPKCKPTNWCMKPYPEIRGITPGKCNFNKALSRARVVIEQAFGMLKGRWHFLLVKLDESVDKIPLTIITCCILHNICIEVCDDVDVDPKDDDPDELPPLPGHMNCEGSQLRDKIEEAFFSN
ncbi:protein ALP1-like [Orbicella faveolata]|uniref:protein ALP1-like n=1 Tax=Orbicella faveolata TaxID=48498 RepID=UPI0009E51AB2|nr:protein ALP1-like [Orbicella faveolata]